MDTIVTEQERLGEEVARTVRSRQDDKVNPGEWFASKFAERQGLRR